MRHWYHQSIMRTTLTLNDTLYDRIVTLAHERNVPIKDAVAEVVRIGFATLDRAASEQPRFTITPHAGGPTKPEFNYAKVQELLDYSEGDDRKW